MKPTAILRAVPREQAQGARAAATVALRVPTVPPCWPSLRANRLTAAVSYLAVRGTDARRLEGGEGAAEWSRPLFRTDSFKVAEMAGVGCDGPSSNADFPSQPGGRSGFPVAALKCLDCLGKFSDVTIEVSERGLPAVFLILDLGPLCGRGRSGRVLPPAPAVRQIGEDSIARVELDQGVEAPLRPGECVDGAVILPATAGAGDGVNGVAEGPCFHE